MILFAFASGIVIIFLYQYRKKLADSYTEVELRTAPLRSKLIPVPQHYREILSKYFFYYQQLPTLDKRTFEQRLIHFVLSKKFIPRNFQTVTDEMKVTIAATAVQLTFGLPTIYFQHFRKILIYPDDYYSNITKRYHRGEVNPAYGIIVLSWRSFVEGFSDPTNGTNVGLHEMAHALRLENMVRNEEFGFLDEDALDVLNYWAERVCDTAQQSVMFFRAYACVNKHEFFAVAVENFFEKPTTFNAALPELYKAMVELLKQNPLTLSTSYASNPQ